MADLPEYCAPAFTLMPAASTSRLSGQVLGFGYLSLLTQSSRLLCGSCSSGQRFAYSFLQIPPRGGHPCCSANDSPCRVRKGLSPSSKYTMSGTLNIWLLRSREVGLAKAINIGLLRSPEKRTNL